MLTDSAPCGPRDGHEVGRALLARLYRTAAGAPMPPVLKGPYGKPYFRDGPWHFSISHTNERVFCVLSQRPVGIDAEPLGRQVDLRLADRILSPGERSEYDSAPDKRLALLTFWVLKEAWVKYTGRGLQGYPNDTHFSLSDPRVTVRDGCIVAIIQGDTEDAV